MEVPNGVCMEERGGPPPPSPLTGCYLLIVIGEPHTTQHKDIILQKIAKGLLSWNVTDCLVDLEKELNIITEQGLEGEEARFGERLIQFASENLVTEILIHPAVNTLQQCIRNLLSSFTKHRHIIHAGYTFQANGSWALQDGTFSYADFSEAFQELEVQRVIKAYENGITLDIHCSAEGEWPKLPKESFARACKVRINPTDVLTTGSPSITDFVAYLSPFLVPTTLESILESSDVVGNIRFSRPTLYVFPGGQGDAALFGINGFNMLLDGGYSRKACFWDFVRHLDRLDAVLLTRLNNSSIGGIRSVLKRKTQEAVYPQIGHFFCNLQERRSMLSPDGDKDRDPLLINLLEEGQNIIQDLKSLNLTPQFCYRDTDPIILYHKVGHGTLNMYVLSPEKNSREVREFIQKWNSSDQRLFSSPRSGSGKDFVFPLQNLVSICALLVWQPSNPNDTITRILYPGSTPQKKIFDGLDRLKSLEYIKHPVCSERSLMPIKKSSVKKEEFLDKIIPLKEKKIIENGDNKTHEKENGDVINKDKHQAVKKTDSLENNENKNIARSKKAIEETTNNKILENGGDRVSKPRPKVDSKPSKSRAESQGRKKPAAGAEKKGPPTPKKTLDNKLNGESKEKPEKQDKDKIIEKKPIRKPSPSATPAKSTKDANNRKVVEEKKQPLKKELVSKGPAKEESREAKEPKPKTERKPISRRPKTAKAPTSPMKKMSNGVQKPDSLGKRGKLDKEGTTDSSTVSTPSADQESAKKDLSKLTPEEIQKLKEKELKEMQEEQEAVKEIEAVFRKGEGKATDMLEEDARKIKADVSLDDKLDTEEYLIIEKEEVESTNEIQKLTKDSQETEKDKKEDELIKEIEQPEKFEKGTEKEETQTSDLEKAEINADDVSEAKKVLEPVSDEKIEMTPAEKKELLEEEPKEIMESQPEEKTSANIESGTTTTAPTLPEDERITLDDIKEDSNQHIEEKHEKEETIEKPEDKGVPKIDTPPKEKEVQNKLLPAVAGIKLDRSSHIRDIVKTPDEVADLPVHEEADFDGNFGADDKKLNEKIEPDDKKIDISKKVEEKGKDNEKESDVLEKSELESKEKEKETDILRKEKLDEEEIHDKKTNDVVNDTEVPESKKEKTEDVKKDAKVIEEKSDIEKDPKDIVQVIDDDEWVVISKEEQQLKEKETLQEALKDDMVQEAIEIDKLAKTEDHVALKNEVVSDIVKKDIDVKTDTDKVEMKQAKETEEDKSAELDKDITIEKEKEEVEIKQDKKADLNDSKKEEKEVTDYKAQEKQSVDIDSKTEVNTKDLPKDLDLSHDIKQAIDILKDPTPSVEEIKEIHSKIIEDKITTIKVAKDEVEKIDEKMQELKDNQAEELKLDKPKMDLTEIEEPKEVDDFEKKVEVLTAIDDKLQILKDQEEKKTCDFIVDEKKEDQVESTKKETDEKDDEKKKVQVESMKQETEEKHDPKLPEMIETLEIKKKHDQVEDIKQDTNKKSDIQHEEKTEEVKAELSKSPEIAEKVTLPDSSPEEDDLKIIDQLKHIDKVELGRKSPQEREKDVETIVAGVAEVLKSDAPIEVLAEKLPFSQAFTQELRETHITTQDSPIIESKIIEHISTIHEVPEESLHNIDDKIDENKGVTTELVEDLSTKFPDLYGKVDDSNAVKEKDDSLDKKSSKTDGKDDKEDESHKITDDSTEKQLDSHQESVKRRDLIAESKELLSETSKIISDIQKSPFETEESEDAGIVHRMLVTASSEDGGEEIEICPVGTIIFSRSSESSGRSSPDPSAKMSHKSSIVDTISETLSTVKQVIDERGLATEEDVTETKEKELEPKHLEMKDKKNLTSEEGHKEVESDKETVKGIKSEKSSGQSTPEHLEKGLEHKEESKVVDSKSSGRSTPDQLDKSNLPLESEKSSQSGKCSGKSTPDTQEKKDEDVVLDKANIIASLDQDSAKSSSRSSTPEPANQKEIGFFGALNYTLESAKDFVKDKFDEISKGTTDTLAKVKEEKDNVLKDFEQKTDSAIKDSTDAVTKHKEDMTKKLEKLEEKFKESKEEAADKIEDIHASAKDKLSSGFGSFKEEAQKLENDIKEEIAKAEKILSDANKSLIDKVDKTSKKTEEKINEIKTEVKEDLSEISKEVKDTKQQLADNKEKLESEAAELKDKIGDAVKETSSKLEELSQDIKTDLVKETNIAAKKIEAIAVHAGDTLSELKKDTKITLDHEIGTSKTDISDVEKKSSGELSPKSPALSGKGSPDLVTKKIDLDAKDFTSEKMEVVSKESSRTTSPDVKQKISEKQVEITENVIKEADKLLEKSEQVLSAITPTTSDIVMSEKPDISTDIKDIAPKTEKGEEIFTRVKRDVGDLDAKYQVDRGDEVTKKDEIAIVDPVKDVQEISNDFKRDKDVLEKEEQAIEAKVLHMQKSIDELEDMSKSVVFEMCETNDFINQVDRGDEVTKKDEIAIVDPVKHVQEISNDFKRDKDVLEKEEKAIEAKVLHMQKSIDELEDMSKSVVFEMCETNDFKVDPDVIKKEEKQIEQEVKHLEKTLDDVVKLQKEISFEKVGEAAFKEYHVDPAVIKTEEKQIEQEVKHLEDTLNDITKLQKEISFEKVGEAALKEYHVDTEVIKTEEKQIEQEVKHLEETLDDVTKLQKEISFEKIGEADIKEYHVDPELIKKEEKQIEQEVKHLEETLDDVTQLQKEISFEKIGEAGLKEYHVKPEVIKKEEKQIEQEVKHLEETTNDIADIEKDISFEKVSEAAPKNFSVDPEVIKNEIEHLKHVEDEICQLQKEVSFDKVSDDFKVDSKILEKEEKIIQQQVEHVEKILNDVEKFDESISFDKCSISSTASTAKITDHEEESKISEDSKEKPLAELDKDAKEVQKEFIESAEHDTLATVSTEKDKEKVKEEIKELQQEFIDSIEHDNLEGISIEKDKNKLVSEIKELQEDFVESIEHDTLKGVDLQKEKERVQEEIQKVQDEFIDSVEHDLAETISVDKDKKKIVSEITQLEQDFIESISHDNEETISIEKDHKKIESEIKNVQEGFMESLDHSKENKEEKADIKVIDKDVKKEEKLDTPEKCDIEKKLDDSIENLKDQKDKSETILHDIKSDIREVQDSFLDSIPSDRSISPESDRETSFEKELKLVDNKFLEERLKIGESSGNKSEIKYEVGPGNFDELLGELKELKLVDKKSSKEEKTDQPEKSDKNGETQLDLKSQDKDIKDLVNKVATEVRMDFVEAEFKGITGKELEKDTVTSKTQETDSKYFEVKTVEDKIQTKTEEDQKAIHLQAKDSDIKDLIEKVSEEVKMDFVEAEYQGLTGKPLVTEKGEGESMEKQKVDTLEVGERPDAKKLSISDVEIGFKDKEDVKDVTKSFLESEKQFESVPSNDQIDSKVFKPSQDDEVGKRDDKVVETENKVFETDEKASGSTKKEEEQDTKLLESIASVPTSSSTLQVSPVDANISGKSSPDISGKSTAPVSPSLKDSQSTDAKMESKIDSGLSEQTETDDDDLSTKSQVAPSDLEEMDQQLEKMDPMSMSFYGALPDETDSFLEIPTASTYLYEVTKAKYSVKLEDETETEEEIDRKREYSKKHDVMNSSFIGELPPPKSDDVMTSSFIGTLPETSDSQTKKDDVVDQWGKPLGLPAPTYHFEEHHSHYSRRNQEFDVMTSSFIGELPGTTEDFPSHRFPTNQDPMSTSMYFDSSEADQDPIASWGKPLGLPSPGSPNLNVQVTLETSQQRMNHSIGSEISSEEDIALPDDFTDSRTANIDPIAHWGKPLGLPSPAPPTNGTPGTPKKEKKLNSNIATKNKINDDKKRALSPSKRETKKVNPVYVDLTYVPHHGNHYYSYVDFFKRIRARYYVFSGLEPSKIVYDALLEAKQTWEDKELEVTIIPTYDTDILGYWVAENEDLLAKAKIDLSPSASRCTINLQDHETSCAAYRLEF